jgi:MoxR-like ATPase
MNYDRKYFDPESRGGQRLKDEPGTVAFEWSVGTARDVYLFEPRVTLAVNIAMAAKRPLLIAGEPGSGKTRLAAAVAEVLQWQFYPKTVTSRMQATDLLWTFNALDRLNDATSPERKLLSQQHYVVPENVWWGFSPSTAQNRGLKALPGAQLTDPVPPKAGKGAVVLVDEIDKADPDVPNDLLEPFDVREFTVKETKDKITAVRDVFLVLTTNGERELPPAFLRRCVVLALANPDQNWFERIGKQHFPDGDPSLQQRVAAEVQRLRGESRAGARKPSTAEFIDALRVCGVLGLDPKSSEWVDIVDAVLLKREQFVEAKAGLQAQAAPAGQPIA